MRKKSLSEKSKIQLPENIDLEKPLSPSELARLAGCYPSTVSRGIDAGSIVATDGKIFLGDIGNVKWLVRRLTSEIKYMSEKQRNQTTVFLKKLESIPATTPAATGPQPYSPSKLSPENYYHLVVKQGRQLLKLAKIFIPENGGCEIDLFESVTISIDDQGRVDGLFYEDQRIADLLFILVDG
jgi:hypothetical protein